MRIRLQELFFSNNKTNLPEILTLLEKISDATDISQEICVQSKIGILLRTVFCSEEYSVWHDEKALMLLVQKAALALIAAK